MLAAQIGAFCHVRGCVAEKVASPADTLNKSRHKPGQQGQPNRRSISFAKCMAQLLSLNLVNIECASPILIWTFILWAIVLRKVPQTGNSSMARTPAFFADCLRASPWHSVTKTQKAKSKIVH